MHQEPNLGEITRSASGNNPIVSPVRQRAGPGLESIGHGPGLKDQRFPNPEFPGTSKYRISRTPSHGWHAGTAAPSSHR